MLHEEKKERSATEGARRTAPDPPESQVGAAMPCPSPLRRLSTPCSQDPPDTKEQKGSQTTYPHNSPDMTGQKGIDPDEYQIKDTFSDVKSSVSRQSNTSHGEAIVLYEPPTPTAMEETSHPICIDRKGDKLTPKPGTPKPGNELVQNPGNELVLKPGNEPALKTLYELALKPGNELALKSPPPEPKLSKDMRSGLDHCFVTVPCRERLSVLFATLRRSRDRKVIVVCSTWESASFHAVLFRQLEMLRVYEMHENTVGGVDVARAYDKFLYLYPGILFASEIAMREFDIPPNLDYLIQYEPPADPAEYIYRASSAKVYRTSCRKALLFLSPEELKFLEYFDDRRGAGGCSELEARRVNEFQESAERLVAKHGELNDLAWRAFQAYILAYANHSRRNVYNRDKVDEEGVRRSFGQPHVPGYSSKYFLYNHGRSDGKKEEKESNDGQSPNPKLNQWKDKEKTWRQAGNQWTDKEKTWGKVGNSWSDKERTWRQGGKPWTTRESKTWKHTHVSLKK